MHAIHDAGYKKLFSNKTIFRELIQTFVRESWVKDLDFDHCETLDKSFIADHYKETESDLIYKVRFRGHDAYLFVLLEFQSYVDRFMAVRVLSYVTSFYLDYARDNKHVRKLPPVFPIVLYNGDRRWTAPTTLSALLQEPTLLGKYTPRFQYFKVAEREYSKEELLRIRNIVSTLFLAEAYYDRELIINECLSVFRHEDDRQAVSLLLNWFRQLMEHGQVQAGDYRELELVFRDVEEAKGMLITALEKERKKMRAEMRVEVREEVRAEVAQEVRAEVAQEVRAEVAQEVRAEVAQEVRAEVAQEVRAEVAQEVRAEVAQEVRAESLAEGKSVGLIEGLQEGIILSLNAKFGEMALPLFPEIRQIHDIALLQEVMTIIVRSEQLVTIKDVIERGKRTSSN